MPEADHTIADRLSRFAASLDYDAIPSGVLKLARMHLLDAVGAAFASASFEFARRTFAALAAFGSGDFEAIGMPGKLGLRDAVLFNGILTHGLDFDDTSIYGRVHPSSFLAPCILGMGAHVGATGKQALTAYIAGMECAIRIGAAARGGFQRSGFHPTGVVAAFGCAIAAGRLLKLTPEQLTMAQGIVYSTAAGNNEFTANDAWTKRMHAGWAGVCGITSAMLAAGGFVGPRTPYEGKFGLYKVYLGKNAENADLDLATADLGTRWEVERVAFKPIASCHFNHPIIESTVAVVTEHDLKPADIKEIRALLPEAAIQTVCEPQAVKRAPSDIYGAQFSVYYAAACAAIRRRYTLADLDPPAPAVPEILELARRVTYAIDPDSSFPRQYSGGVEITTYDGRKYVGRDDVNRGSPERPLSDAEIEAKFLANAGRVLPAARAQALRDLILDIEKVEPLRTITRELSL